MKKRYFLALLLLALAPRAPAQQPAQANLTAQAASCPTTGPGATTSSLIVRVQNTQGGYGINLSGTWSGTVSFFGTTNGQTGWSALAATPINGNSAVTTSTANGNWQVNSAGLQGICVLVTTYSSGTVAASIIASNASARTNGGTGGSGTVTSVTFTGDGIVDSSTPSAAVTASGTLTSTLANAAQNSVLAGQPSGGAAAPTYQTAPTLGNLGLLTAGVYNWNSDTGMSRDSSGSVDVGNGTAADKSGTLNAATLNASSSVGVGASPPAGCPATGCIALTEAGSAGTPTAGVDYMRADSGSHAFLCSFNGAAETACGSVAGANAALSNLSAVSINTSLLAQTGVDLGSTSHQFRNIYFFGAGTYGTTYMELTGTPTSTRTWTFQDSTDTVVGRATTDTLTNKSIALTEINSGLTSGGVACATSTTVFAMSAALTSNVLPKGGGAGACPSNSSITDNATTVTTTDTGGYVAPVFVANGTTAGFADFPQGSTSASVAPCNTATSICEQAPTSVTSYMVTKPGAAPVIASYKQTDGCASAKCTESYHPVPVLLTVASDFTDSTSTSLQLITGLSTTLPVSQGSSRKLSLRDSLRPSDCRCL